MTEFLAHMSTQEYKVSKKPGRGKKVVESDADSEEFLRSVWSPRAWALRTSLPGQSVMQSIRAMCGDHMLGSARLLKFDSANCFAP